MKNLKKAAAVTMVAGGLVAAGAGMASAHGHGGAHADGVATKSPGVGSGNLVQAPIHIPVNACGNTVTVIGALNPTFGNVCANV
ncbi:chaplin [Streptomyces sp. NPDC046465]|uniref:chaplin n=1 Tax=Streptomyces sp. NPDC046465 TaxID=3155810 RepID=UPI00341143DA